MSGNRLEDAGPGERNPPGPRVALALAGGGPLGGVFEVGALRALDTALDGLEFDGLHALVGVSAGGLVAACLANGIGSEALSGLLIGSDDSPHNLAPERFFRPAWGEYARRLSGVPRLAVRAASDYVRAPWQLGILGAAARLTRALPPGVFDNDPIRRWLKALFSVQGRSDDFRALSTQLYIVATELDTGEVAVFGAPGRDDVPISRAVQASTALPGMYLPVEIDGRYFVDGALRKTVHASVALDAGADLVICINPLVPFDARAGVDPEQGLRQPSLVHGGLPAVMGQTFRSLIHSRMEAGMGKYEAEYPGRDVLVFEPSRDDARMFFANVFSFANRERVCAHAYAEVLRQLAERRDELRPVLARHGIAIRDSVLDSPPPLRLPRGSLAATMEMLSGTLDELEREIGDADDQGASPGAREGAA